MNRNALIAAWLDPSIQNLAALIGEDAAGVEYAIRHELLRVKQEHEIQQAEAEPPAERAVTEGNPSPRKASEAGASSPRPARQKNHAAEMKRDPVRRRMAAAISAALDLTGYPASLQDPRAETQRRVYDAVKEQGGTTVELSGRTGLTSDNISTTLSALRSKNLVRGSETTPVVWRVA